MRGRILTKREQNEKNECQKILNLRRHTEEKECEYIPAKEKCGKK